MLYRMEGNMEPCNTKYILIHENVKSSLICKYKRKSMSRDSSVGIASRYGLDGPGIESRWGQDFCTRLDRPWGPPSFLYNGYRVFPGGKAAGAWH
jgi:hypothetical protein